MAKETLQKYLNRNLKSKGTTAKEAKKNASKYSSISAAKKAGSLYYTDKNGKVMAAVFAGDLKEDKPTRPQSRPFDEKAYLKAENLKIKEDEARRRALKLKEAKKYLEETSDRQPMNFKAAAEKRKEGRKENMNKGGPVKKKVGAYNKGGMPMVMKAGKKVPAFAADGVGKMNMGGMAKKKPAAKMMAGGMAKKKPAAKMMAGGMAKKKPAAKMMAGGMSKSGYMYGGTVKKKK